MSLHSLLFWRDNNVAFQRQKTSARYFHSPTVSLPVSHAVFISYSMDLIHNVDTVDHSDLFIINVFQC